MTPKSERESTVSLDQIIVDHPSTMGFGKPSKGTYSLPVHTISQELRYGKEINAQITPLITTRNVAWRQKNVKGTFQEAIRIGSPLVA